MRRDAQALAWVALTTLVPLGIAGLLGRQRRGPAASEPAGHDPAGTVEVGVTGGDLAFWRVQEAIRYAELKLAAQVGASQSLEARAISLIGWSVTGLLALGAAIVGGTHVIAAGIGSVCLFAAAVLGVLSILRRRFYTGYAPDVLLQDRSSSEYEALLSLAHGYQRAVEQNQQSLDQTRHWLTACVILLVAAPFASAAAFLAVPPAPGPADYRVVPIRAASVSAARPAATGWRVSGPSVSWP